MIVDHLKICMKGIHSDLLWLNDDKISLRVHRDKIPDLLDKGWVLGRHYFSRPKVQAITNGVENKRVLHSELQDWVAKGWRTGKFKTNKITVTNGKINKKIDPDQVPEGFKVGSWLVTAIGRRWVTDGIRDVYLKRGEELPVGFEFGRSSFRGKKNIGARAPSCKGKISITDGHDQRFIILGVEKIPEGWYPGTRPKKKWSWSKLVNLSS